jgi:hypothetical protein
MRLTITITIIDIIRRLNVQNTLVQIDHYRWHIVIKGLRVTRVTRQTKIIKHMQNSDKYATLTPDNHFNSCLSIDNPHKNRNILLSIHMSRYKDLNMHHTVQISTMQLIGHKSTREHTVFIIRIQGVRGCQLALLIHLNRYPISRNRNVVVITAMEMLGI